MKYVEKSAKKNYDFLLLISMELSYILGSFFANAIQTNPVGIFHPIRFPLVINR